MLGAITTRAGQTREVYNAHSGRLTRFGWIYFANCTSDVPGLFLLLLADISWNHRHVECVRSDNGGEFIG